MTNAPAKIGRGKFSGDLSAFSIFEVCQFLMIVRHTGTFTIRSDGRNGTITISEGQMVSVVDDVLKEGEDTFYKIVTWKDGTFEFAPCPVAIGATPKIPMSTDGLLLEAARKLDEGEIGDGVESDDSAGTHASAVLRNQQFAGEFAELLTSLDGQHDDGFN